MEYSPFISQNSKGALGYSFVLLIADSYIYVSEVLTFVGVWP